MDVLLWLAYIIRSYDNRIMDFSVPWARSSAPVSSFSVSPDCDPAGADVGDLASAGATRDHPRRRQEFIGLNGKNAASHRPPQKFASGRASPKYRSAFSRYHVTIVGISSSSRRRGFQPSDLILVLEIP